jgi:protein SCO1/2
MQLGLPSIRWMLIRGSMAMLVAGQSLAEDTSAPVHAWPADSLYHVDAPIQTASGRATTFAKGGGRTRIVTMFYASCPMACPMTIGTLKNLDAELSPGERAKLDVLLLSIDPERDTPVALTRLAQEHRITDVRWTLARASPSDTRKLAAALGIQYRALDNGDFDHASTLVLLDAKGRMLARSNRLGVPSPEFLAAVRRAVSEVR